MFRRVSGAGVPSGPGPGWWGPFLHGDRSPALDPQQPGTSVRPQASPSLRAQQLRGQCDGTAGDIIHRVLGQWQLLLSSILRHARLGHGSHCNRSKILNFLKTPKNAKYQPKPLKNVSLLQSEGCIK